MAGHSGTHSERHKYYVAKAAEADQKAAETMDYAARQTWLELAKNWRWMADQIERNFKL